MLPDYLDKPKDIRPGEELNLVALEKFLNENLHSFGNSVSGGKLHVMQFPSGFSNLTYLLRLGDEATGIHLVLRRPPFGAKIKSGHDMAREYNVLKALYPVYNKVPKVFLYTEDENIIGAPFYVMERVPGIILRGQPPKGLALTPETMSLLSQSLVEALVGIHTIDIEAAGLTQFGKPEGYIRRQVEGWTQRYRNAQTDEVSALEMLIRWLAEHIQENETLAQEAGAKRATLIHNDFKYDNLVLDPQNLGKVIAVLDWEMATLGDPHMDLGTTLGYWIEASDPEPLRFLGPTSLPGNFSRQQVLHAYEQLTGTEVKNPLFYYVFGLLKICVICQQIYFRFHKGLTKDPRFAMLNVVVSLLAQMGERAIEKNKL